MRLILASSSPRRKSLLTHAGFIFAIQKPNTPEVVIKGEPPQKMVLRLSQEKAAAIAKANMQNNCVILSADTTVVEPKNKKILNKPESTLAAEKMLRMISDKKHTVLTGYTVLMIKNGKIKKRISRVVKTTVKIKKLTSHFIKKYIESGEPMDKAGSYAAQGIGMLMIESIWGSYTNVVGLPMKEVYDDLTACDIFPLWIADSKM